MAVHCWKCLLVFGLFLLFGAKGLEETDATDADYEEEYYDEYYDKAKEEKMRGIKPKILSEPVSRVLRRGEDTELLCDTEDAEAFVIMWKLGEKMLFMILSPTSKMDVAKDEHLSLHGQTLRIRDVQPEHLGNYTCEISSDPTVSLTHQLDVLHAAAAVGGKKEVTLGQSVVIKCDITGNPQPKVTWTRQGKRMPTGEHRVTGDSITLASVQIRDAGVYQCLADNGLGEPAAAQVRLEVVYAPVIETEKSFVHDASGTVTAELTCIVKASPKATVVWYKDGVKFSPSDSRLSTRHTKTRHNLKIENVQDQDFGTYNCQAGNKLGRATGNIRLQGLPSPAVILDTLVKDKDYIISWEAQSLASVEIFRVMYRKVQDSDPSAWVEVAVLPSDDSDGYVYKGSYRLKGLHSHTTYEAKVLAKNSYGWSSDSEMHHFTTKDTDNVDPEPEPSDAAPQPSNTLGDMSARPQPSDSKTKKEAKGLSAGEVGTGQKKNTASSYSLHSLASCIFVVLVFL